MPKPTDVDSTDLDYINVCLFATHFISLKILFYIQQQSCTSIYDERTVNL